MAEWGFADRITSPLTVGEKTPAAQSAPKPDRHRQSAAAAVLLALRRLPGSAPFSAGVIFAATRLFPSLSTAVQAWSAALLTIGIAVLSGVISWLCSFWQLEDGRLLVRSGVLVRREYSLPLGSVLAAGTEKTPFTALFGAARLRVRSAEAGSRPLTLLLNKASATRLAAQLLPSSSGRSHSYTADRYSLLLAAAGGDGLTAFCSAALPVLSAARDLLNAAINEYVLRRGFLLAAALTVTLAWLFKLFHTLVTHAGMNISLSGKILSLNRGVISRRGERINLSSISVIDRRISLFGCLLGRSGCTVSLAGGHTLPLLPPVDQRRLRMESAALAPHGRPVCTVQPTVSAVGYASLRWLCCLAILPAISLAEALLPGLRMTVTAAGLTAVLLLLWRALITTLCASQAGLRVFSDCAELTGVRALSIHTLRVFRPSVGIIRITQSPISRAMGRCTLRIYPRGRSAALSSIKLPYERTLAACERMV